METVVSPYVGQLEEFLTEYYKNDLEKLAEEYPNKRSLEIDYENLEKFDVELADELIVKPYTIIHALEEAIKQMSISIVEDFAPHIRFLNLPKELRVEVKDINSDKINKFLTSPGVITKITEVKPKIISAVFECRHCGRLYTLPQTDLTGKLIEPTICACERKSFQLLEEQSTFIDTQKAEIQEPLESSRLRGSEQARTISVWLEDDMTNELVPGDKIDVTGIFRLKSPKTKGAIYDKFLHANHVLRMEQEFEELELSDEDEKKILELSKDPNIYEKIVNSISPSLYGLREIKEAIALQLFGGTYGKIAPDGMKIRPDIHLLLIGDPGTGKSRLLQYVNSLAPKGIYVSGKSTSGAGLTATAERDDFGGGGWTLKAGALVLAAGGMAMIDEFDKMGDEDRSSMHEAMESQEIHVAKAGIITTFKANSTILAAANPKFSRFDPYSTPAEQLNILPTILSRFDAIFPIKDVVDSVKDKELANYVLTTHQVAGARIDKDEINEELEEKEKLILPDIDPELLRKYIAYARKNVNPILSPESITEMENFYLDLRRISGKQSSIAITARQLEAIVRMAEASAKGRLSPIVEIEDAQRAIKILKYYMKEIAMDPETGEFDVDIVATGTAKSKMDKVKTVFNIIRLLNKEYDEVSYEAILDEAKEKGVKPEELEKFLSQLKRSGDIYSPRYGHFKPAEQQRT